jgi:hypothetical protein
MLVAAIGACSTAPTTGSSSTAATSTISSTSGGTGGLDGGACEKVHIGPICGYCEACMEANCCAILTTCAKDPNCFYCAVGVDTPPDGGYPDCQAIPFEAAKQWGEFLDCATASCRFSCFGKDPFSDAGQGGAGAGGNCGGGGSAGASP